jgi:hypothetical protein
MSSSIYIYNQLTTDVTQGYTDGIKTLENSEGEILKDNTEKLATLDTKDEEKQNKNKTQYVLDTHANKTCTLPQTTGGNICNIVIYNQLTTDVTPG